MAINPFIPILALGGLVVAVLTSKEGKKGPASVPTPEGALHGFTLGDFTEGEPLQIAVHPTDMIRFDFAFEPETGHWSWNSEAVEGAPTLQVEATEMRPDPKVVGPGYPWRYIVDLIVHPGPGVFRLNLEKKGAAGHPDESRTALIRVA